MTRPTEITGLSGDDFVAYYWRKAELLVFCRKNELPTSGSKQMVTACIKHFLDTGEVLRPEVVEGLPGRATMPSTFTRETIVGDQWRCSQALRAFFEAEIGAAFHFNQFMRNFIKRDGVGQPLAAAIEGWRRSKLVPASAKEIQPQFEYNRHMRTYFAQNPEATREEAIRIWNEKKATRRAKENI